MIPLAGSVGIQIHSTVKMKTPLLLAILLACLSSGCALMHASDHEHYSKYVQHTNELNVQREKASLAPIHVLTFDEWYRGEKAKK